MADHKLAWQAWGKRQLRVRECRNSLLDFTREVALNEEGQPVDVASLHLMWHLHLDYCWSRGLRCMIISHFGSGKSSGFAVPLAAWLIGNNPQIRIKVVANSDEMAKNRTGAIKRIVESVPYKEVFPEVTPGGRWSDQEIFVKRVGFSPEPTVRARGVFTTGVGGRSDVSIFDDVVDQKNAEDSAQRRRVLNLVERTWLSRLEPGRRGRVLWIATLWHMDDASHVLMQRPGWCTLIQRVSDSCEFIEQTVTGAGTDYPEFTATDLEKMLQNR